MQRNNESQVGQDNAAYSSNSGSEWTDSNMEKPQGCLNMPSGSSSHTGKWLKVDGTFFFYNAN